ncbi:hypothetical protein GCM10009616_06720 [Microlunatus lacustris]
MTTQTVARTTSRRAPLLTGSDTRLAPAGTRGPFSGRVSPPPAGTAFASVQPAHALDLELPGGARVLTAGVDLTDVQRIATALHRTGSSLVRRVCGPAEQVALAGLGPALLPWGLAVSFGLTEAAVKAAGGIPPGSRFPDVDASALITRLGGPADASSSLSAVVEVGGATGRRLHALGTDLALTGGARRVGPHLLVCWVLLSGSPR